MKIACVTDNEKGNNAEAAEQSRYSENMPWHVSACLYPEEIGLDFVSSLLRYVLFEVVHLFVQQYKYLG